LADVDLPGIDIAASLPQGIDFCADFGPASLPSGRQNTPATGLGKHANGPSGGICLSALRSGREGRQSLDLPLGLQHRFMGTVQIIEMTDQGVDSGLHIADLEHMLAHETGEIARPPISSRRSSETG
jgi:hypothetical protein